MGSNGVIEVVIGLVLMYLALSIFCTVANELMATVFGWRAKSLATGIGQLIDHPPLRNDFYNHGLIDGAKSASTAGGKPGKSDHPSYISGKVFAMALLGSLDPTKPLQGFSEIEDAVKNLPDCNIRDILLAHIIAADNDLTKLRECVAIWFDNTMDRLGGVYQRKLKYVSFGIGLLLAAGINADTITVSKALWQDSALREQMVKVAEHVVSSKPPAVESANGQTLTAAVEQIRMAEDELRPLPIGWHRNQASAINFMDALLKLAGLLLTTLALTLGAPFWFDLLSKFIHLRGTGEKPERTDAP
jgi:hypothetical protein